MILDMSVDTPRLLLTKQLTLDSMSPIKEDFDA